MRFPQIVQGFHIGYTVCKDNKLFRKPKLLVSMINYCCPCEAGQRMTFFRVCNHVNGNASDYTSIVLVFDKLVQAEQTLIM
jgi:hypothetical protein